jgi:hypothetical protein
MSEILDFDPDALRKGATSCMFNARDVRIIFHAIEAAVERAGSG